MWFCPCPRCRIEQWDFVGSPPNENWTPDGSGWQWTPQLTDCRGGYSILVSGNNVSATKINVGLLDADGLEVRFNLSLQGGLMFLGDKLIASAELEGYPTWLKWQVCHAHGTRGLTIWAEMRDENGTLICQLGQTLGLLSDAALTFTNPVIEIAGGANFAAIDIKRGEPPIDQCCPACTGGTCELFRAGLDMAHPAAIFGTEWLHASAEWYADSPEWIIITLGECCEGEYGATGDLLGIDVAFALKNMQLRLMNCSSHHDNQVIDVPIIGNWLGTGMRKWSFALCIVPIGDGIDISVGISEEGGGGGRALRHLYWPLSGWARHCWPEFTGDGDPGTVFIAPLIVNIYIPTVSAFTSTMDICDCIPYTTGIIGECVRPLCEQPDPPTITPVATVQRLPGFYGWRWDGSYVLDSDCDLGTSTETTSAEGFHRSIFDDPAVMSAIEQWMATAFPTVFYDQENPIRMPFYCSKCHGEWEVCELPCDGSAFWILGYWPDTIHTEYRRLGLIPVMVEAFLFMSGFVQNPNTGQVVHAGGFSRAFLAGAATWPACTGSQSGQLQLIYSDTIPFWDEEWNDAWVPPEPTNVSASLAFYPS